MKIEVRVSGNEEVSLNIPIQALRGLAVVLVVFYHSRLVFRGGFVGVDVFFVISGFLIASSVIREISRDQSFSKVLREFYLRRVTRLIPALAVTTSVSVAISFFVYSPYVEFQQVSVSALSALLFVANGRFFLLNDYTSLASDPFRHAWSLAVEEQFYLVFPIGVVATVLIFGRRRYLGTLFWLVLVLAISSFVLNVLLSIGVRITPLPRRFGFFSPVSRAWQIGAGVLLSMVQESVKAWFTRTTLARMVVVLGSLLIVYSGLKLDEFDDYPGVRAVMPVCGAVLVILGGLSVSDWRPSLIKLFQHLGDISYSFYLVHWPLLVIARRIFSDTESISLLSIPAAYVLAWIQFRFVERRFWTPIRHSQGVPSP